MNDGLLLQGVAASYGRRQILADISCPPLPRGEVTAVLGPTIGAASYEVGPEFVAREVREWIQSQGFKTLYIEPGAPWQNSYTESFNARFRDEFLNVELFSSKLEAKVLSSEHREKYNTHRPHSSLEGMTPREFAARCLATLRPTAYAPQDIETNPKQEQILS